MERTKKDGAGCMAGLGWAGLGLLTHAGDTSSRPLCMACHMACLSSKHVVASIHAHLRIKQLSEGALP